MNKKSFGGLFFNAVLALTLISFVPILMISYHIMNVNGRVLQNEILQKQITVAGRIASVARQQMIHSAQLFSIFTDLHTDLGGHGFLGHHDLEYLRTHTPSVFYLAVLTPQGKELFSSGTSSSTQSYQPLLKNILQTCVKRGKDYIGPFSTRGRTLVMWMAFPIRQHLGDANVSGVLVAEMDLKDLGNMLLSAYPLDMEAVLATKDGKIISYNGAPRGLALSEQPVLEDEIKRIREEMAGNRTAKVSLADGRQILVAKAELLFPDWEVYVSQPANQTVKLFVESTFHALWDVLFLLILMFIFVLGVSYWVIRPITRPLARLRGVMSKLREEEDYVVRKEDVDVPNNEIGELAMGLVEMSEVLHSRRQEILQAQDQLRRVNQILEERVEARTRELKAATGELVKAERLVAIGQMASIISHEIRNPLAVISNATRLIKMLITSPDPKLLKQIGIIEAEIKQANGIISEVLGYARTRDLMLTMIDLNSYLRDILASFPIPTGISLQDELDSETVRIKVDAEEIKQALRNIISNAIEAMGTGGTLTVGTKVGRKVVCIYISDTGPGISAEVRHSMFAPFYTTKARGTGLGLAVVGKAISRHKGKLFISSEIGKGSCFQIYLKIYKKPGDTSYGEAS